MAIQPERWKTEFPDKTGSLNHTNQRSHRKGTKIREAGDTLIYTVSAFADVQDKTIGDVLQKMPGIDVSATGKISYNGVSINKFYIEGRDLLEGNTVWPPTEFHLQT